LSRAIKELTWTLTEPTVTSELMPKKVEEAKTILDAAKKASEANPLTFLNNQVQEIFKMTKDAINTLKQGVENATKAYDRSKIEADAIHKALSLLLATLEMLQTIVQFLINVINFLIASIVALSCVPNVGSVALVPIIAKLITVRTKLEMINSKVSAIKASVKSLHALYQHVQGTSKDQVRAISTTTRGKVQDIGKATGKAIHDTRIGANFSDCFQLVDDQAKLQCPTLCASTTEIKGGLAFADQWQTEFITKLDAANEGVNQELAHGIEVAHVAVQADAKNLATNTQSNFQFN